MRKTGFFHIALLSLLFSVALLFNIHVATYCCCRYLVLAFFVENTLLLLALFLRIHCCCSYSVLAILLSISCFFLQCCSSLSVGFAVEK